MGASPQPSSAIESTAGAEPQPESSTASPEFTAQAAEASKCVSSEAISSTTPCWSSASRKHMQSWGNQPPSSGSSGSKKKPKYQPCPSSLDTCTVSPSRNCKQSSASSVASQKSRTTCARRGGSNSLKPSSTGASSN